MSNVPSFTLDINTCPCDVCGRRSPCAIRVVNGQPKSASCAVCDREAWEALGERARDEWLSGGSPRMYRPAR